MSFSPANDFGVLVSKGVTEYTVWHVNGRNKAVGTTFVPVCIGGVWRSPQVASATQLRIAAGNANDTAAGSGAREVTLHYIDASGAYVTEALATAGASPSANTASSAIRLVHAEVSKTGTYASTAAGSHAADIVIQNAAGTETWATIDSADYARGQAEIGLYVVPTGKSAIVKLVAVFVESTKLADTIFVVRPGILQAAAPYDPVQTYLDLKSVEGAVSLTMHAPLGPFAAGTAFGFMAKLSSGTGEVSVFYEVWEYDA